MSVPGAGARDGGVVEKGWATADVAPVSNGGGTEPSDAESAAVGKAGADANCVEENVAVALEVPISGEEGEVGGGGRGGVFVEEATLAWETGRDATGGGDASGVSNLHAKRQWLDRKWNRA